MLAVLFLEETFVFVRRTFEDFKGHLVLSNVFGDGLREFPGGTERDSGVHGSVLDQEPRRGLGIKRMGIHAGIGELDRRGIGFTGRADRDADKGAVEASFSVVSHLQVAGYLGFIFALLFRGETIHRPEKVDDGLNGGGILGVIGDVAHQESFQIAGGAEHARHVSAGRVADRADVVGINAVFLRMSANPADGGLGIIDLTREERLVGKTIVEGENNYYHAEFFDIIGYITCAVGMMGVYFLISSHCPEKLNRFFNSLSRNITRIYIIHWFFVVMSTNVIIYRINGTQELPLWQTMLLALIIFLLSYCLSLWLEKRQLQKKAEKKAAEEKATA